VNQSQLDPNSEKAMATVFWDIKEVILINHLPPG
jgi:hypothetical protein